jgi:uncharacterized membrane protein YfcA
MTLIPSINLLYSLSGFCVGALVGMTGVGGGSLMTPILILLFGVHPVSAVGTDLLYAAVTKTGGAVVHGAVATIDWRLVGRLAAGSLPMTVLTLLAMAHFDLRTGAAEQIVTFLLGLTLLATALTLVFRARLVARFGARVDALSARSNAALTVLTGGVLGVLVSVTSVGAGALGVTALVLLYPRLPMVRIVGSDIAHAVPLTLVAGLGHWLAGSVDVAMLGSLVIGSLPGIVLGSYAASRVSDPVLRVTLATVLVVVGGRLVLH